MRLTPSLIGILAGLALSSPAMAFGDPNDPNWPCVQRKVVELSPAATWTGPAFDPATLTWEDDPAVRQLVGYLAQRRVPLSEAETAIREFAEKAGASKPETMTAVYAGLFETLNAERKEVINGIGRFARKQTDFAANVKQRQADLDKLRNDPNTEYATLAAKTDEVLWETRVFEERQKSLTFVCEVPVIIEQRLFSLGKVISDTLK